MTNLTASSSTDPPATSKILAGKGLGQGTVACGAYYTIKALYDSTLCTKAMNAMGSDCDSGVAILKASWSILAVILLALGFSS